MSFSENCGLALILPALASEFANKRKPIYRIIKQLSGANYVNEIVLPLGRANEHEYLSILEAMSSLKTRKRDVSVIWIDSPRIKNLRDKITKAVDSVGDGAKGTGVWLAEGMIIGSGRSRVIAAHDCDIKNYNNRSILANLVHPAMHPDISSQFTKGYYSRIHKNQMKGRVTRLFFIPLFKALREIAEDYSNKKISNFLDFVLELHYPLSGEFTITTEEADKQRITDNFGLETVQLFEAYSKIGPSRICQKEIARDYDHKHQDLESETGRDLRTMVEEITLNLYDRLISLGMNLNVDTINRLEQMYVDMGRVEINKYREDALSEGLIYDSDVEERALKLFYERLRQVGDTVFPSRRYIPHENLVIIPNWERVHSEFPRIYSSLVSAVKDDAKI
jgi:glucosyl-3-phosphoglycerate synthase